MASRWFPLINHFLCGIIVFLLMGSFVIWTQRPSDINAFEQTMETHAIIQKNAFEMPKEAYMAIDHPVFPLAFYPPVLQLPDLRQQITYHGKNGRPDALMKYTVLHFGFKGSQALSSISPGEKLYLQYMPKPSLQPYTFSPNNQESTIWIESSLQDNEVAINVFMKNDKGETIREPAAHAEFRLPEKEVVRMGGNSTWQLGQHRVDGTLLARQHAKWYGKDVFFDVHGGDEFKNVAGKHRIDFGEEGDVYSVFIGLGDCLIWDGNKWKTIDSNDPSQTCPLMHVKKIDDRLMTFELWDVDGKGKMTINMLRSNEAWAGNGSESLQRIFKFVGARKKSQFIFEINEERMLISPKDWLLYTANGWKKLTEESEIDDYVVRKTPGILFVFEGITRKEDHQLLIGKLYNSTRSEMQPVELAILQGGSLSDSPSDEPAEAPTVKSGAKAPKKQNEKRLKQEHPNTVSHDEI